VNFSHCDGEAMAPTLSAIREAARLEKQPVAILADIQGPKLRVGKLPTEGVTLVEGQPFALVAREITGDARAVHTSYQYLAQDLEPGAIVLLADGAIELVVERIEAGDVHCRVVSGGKLFSRKGLNLPGRRLSIETLTDKDRRDLEYIRTTDIDLVAVSFVRKAADLESARNALGNVVKPLVAKLERPEALDNLDEILAASDGVMVARGDLGVELSFDRVPIVQKTILKRAMIHGRSAVVATQMLGSMVQARRPSRAEASDVVNAILDGADAVMLSEETATGTDPANAVQAMAKLCLAGEAYEREGHRPVVDQNNQSFAAGSASAAVSAASQVGASAIVTLAGSSTSALLVSKCRPPVPIVAMASSDASLRLLNLLRGAWPVLVPKDSDVETQLGFADRYLLERGWAKGGDVIVMVAAIPLGEGRETNTIRFHRVRPADT
ncbi:MAG TPA: pyruvate kinase, partial [Polyangiaceae bacterium]|nr:pyruvate kinase [Polyangiaceae bacterium]